LGGRGRRRERRRRKGVRGREIERGQSESVLKMGGRNEEGGGCWRGGKKNKQGE